MLHNGDFFAQVVFTATATMAFSHKVRDFLVIERDVASERLRERVNNELRNRPLTESEERDKSFISARSTIEENSRNINQYTNRYVRYSRWCAWIVLLAALLLLSTNCAKNIGFFSLLALVPFWIFRKSLANKLMDCYQQIKDQESTVDKWIKDRRVQVEM